MSILTSRPSWRHALIVLLCAAMLLTSCDGGGNGQSTGHNAAPPVSSVSIPVQTDDGWVPASLVEVGPAEQPLVDALNRIRRGEFNEIHGFVIIRTGKIVLEE